MSTRSTLRSAEARLAARLMAVVVLPTPPFWLEMQMIRPTWSVLFWRPGVLRGGCSVLLARGLDTDQIHDRTGQPACSARLVLGGADTPEVGRRVGGGRTR